MSTLHIGDVYRTTATFYNAAGVATNPTAVTMKLRKPDGTVSTPTPSSDGSGVYHYDVTIDQDGTWEYSFTGTGTIVASEPGQFYVYGSRVLT